MYIERKWPSRHWLAVGVVQEKLLLWGMRVCGSCDGMQPAKRAGRAREKRRKWKPIPNQPSRNFVLRQCLRSFGVQGRQCRTIFSGPLLVLNLCEGSLKVSPELSAPIRLFAQHSNSKCPVLFTLDVSILALLGSFAIHPYCKINALTLATSRKWLRCHWRLQQRDCRALNVTQV